MAGCSGEVRDLQASSFPSTEEQRMAKVRTFFQRYSQNSMPEVEDLSIRYTVSDDS